jgi:hypothetical protein
MYMTNGLQYYVQIGNLYCRGIKHPPLSVYLDIILKLNPLIIKKIKLMQNTNKEVSAKKKGVIMGHTTNVGPWARKPVQRIWNDTTNCMQQRPS